MEQSNSLFYCIRGYKETNLKSKFIPYTIKTDIVIDSNAQQYIAYKIWQFMIKKKNTL